MMRKKITAIMLICGICLAVSACGGDKPKETEAEPQVVVTEPAENPTEGAAEVAETEKADGESSANATEGDSTTENESVEKSAAVSKSVAVDGNSQMMEFKSENGYSVVYPKKYTVVPESAEIDFLVTDEASGSSVNVVTIPQDSSFLFEIEKKGYENMMLSQEMPVSTLDLYEISEINGIETLRIQYTYNGTEFVQTYYRIDEKKTYCVTYAKVAGVAEDVAKELEAITNSLKVVAE